MIQRAIQRYEAQKDRIYRLSRESGWIIAGQAASVLGSLALVRVLTEYLEPAEYGHLALGLTVAGLVNQVVIGGVVNGISRYYSIAAEHGDLNGYLQAARRLLLFATAAVVALAAILIGLLAASDMGQWLWLAVAALVFSIFSGYNSALNGIQSAARQRAIVALHGGMDAWLKIGLAVVVMLWLGASSASVVAGYALSALIVNLSQFFFLRQLIHKQTASNFQPDKEEWGLKIWSFAWPFSVWGGVTWMQQISDRWALETFASTIDVGHYVVVFQLGYAPIGLFAGLMVALIAPILYQRAGAANDASRNATVHRISWRITQASLALTMIGFVAAFLFHDWLFRWLVAEEYRKASFLLPWVVLAGGLFAAGQMLAIKLASELRTGAQVVMKIVTAVMGIVANVLGAWLYGLEGVVGALVLFSVVYFAWSAVTANRMPYAVRNVN